MASLETKFGHVFTNGEDQYLFIKIVGSGADASAQLALHVQTGELIVRKVGRRLLNLEQVQQEDPERILFSLQAQAQQRGVQPNVSYLQSANELPTPQRQEGKESLYHRVKYFNFYNGGTLEMFWRECETRDLSPPPSLILTMVQDISQALDFMYSMKPTFVIHGDLHWGNVLLHWNENNSPARFFLGDFGRSTCGRARAGNAFGLVGDIRRVWVHVCDLLNAGPSYSSQTELKQYLEEIVEPELSRLARGPASELPDFTRLLELLSAAPAANPLKMRPFMFTHESQSTPSPLLYDTWDEARNARGIHGPWHVGEVSVDRSTGKLSIISVSPNAYHRPHSISEGSHTDVEVDCADMV